MKYFAVIDTNVLVSSMLKGTSIPGIIVDKAINGPIVPLLNNEILEEYEEVLLRNKFGFEEEDVRTLINELRKRAIYLDRTMVDEVFEDPDDVVFYEIVMTARTAVDAYLITGNKKHFPFKSYVVTPREMLEIIGEE
ncbi:MAG: putative toxin-antitoxin system toxin component, PIN family [Spirochaetales bacterium]|nr:putative toxin-antitoxin system toxin component, PIN family [Spirochaetales bacterium]MBQ9809913.1 putative toxin-antitoxin system toxin component, PIN family [Spirochaetales bacterium]